MGIITKIEAQKRNKERVNIYIDDDYAFSLSAELVYKEGLEAKMEVDSERLSKIATEEGFLKCKESALRTIERTYKTEKEMRDKLILKEFDINLIERTIEFLKEYNLLNDENYVKMYVKDKIKNEGQNKIKYALMKKGIKEELIREEISKFNDDSQKEVAYDLAIKKYNLLSKREEDKYKISQKLYRFLIAKGYDYSVVSEVVKKVVNSEELY